MCFTFLAAQGHRIGDSLFEADWVDRCREILASADERDVAVMLPTDVVIAQDLDAGAPTQVVSVDDGIPDGWKGLDIGPQTARAYAQAVLDWPRWCGTGRWECSSWNPSRREPLAVAEALAATDGFTVVGGGIPLLLSACWASTPMRSTTSRPVAAQVWNYSKARPCRESPYWRTYEPQTADGGQLEDAPEPPRGHRPGAESGVPAQDEDYAACDAAVLPPFTDLRSVQTLVEGDKLKIQYRAQDVSEHAAGAYTGEVAAHMLSKLGCTYVTVGHSERRTYHHESDGW